MATTKCLLYCTKRKPYLFDLKGCKVKQRYMCEKSILGEPLNGKIVAECEVETKEICFEKISNGVGYDYHYTLPNGDYINGSCLSDVEMQNYLGEKNGYALFIKNLKIFDRRKELKDYCVDNSKYYREYGWCLTPKEMYTPIQKAPQNMQWCFDRRGNRYALISIRPEWLCKILNEEKTIEIRKKVLKGMCDDE